MEKNIDVAIFGATGFTGQLIYEYLAETYGDTGLKIGLAGRKFEKLEFVHGAHTPNVPPEIVVADADDEEALMGLAQISRVVIAAAGPYTYYGAKLASACAKAGTDYVDLCGESNFIRASIEANSDVAARSGARIVHSCGFDSVPSDLGVYHLQALGRLRFGEPFVRVKGRVEALEGRPSGGTVASILASVKEAQKDPTVGAQMINPFALAPGFEGRAQPNENVPVYDEDLGTWAAPFIMAAINTKNIHRTNHLLNQSYGTEFTYDEMEVTGSGEVGKARALALADPASSMLAGGERPKPGEGPSREEREAGHYTLAFHACENGEIKATVRVEGFQDPGYGSTSKMISECAMCLLKDEVQTLGGVWTAAAAMAAPLQERLTSSGILLITDG